MPLRLIRLVCDSPDPEQLDASFVEIAREIDLLIRRKYPGQLRIVTRSFDDRYYALVIPVSDQGEVQFTLDSFGSQGVLRQDQEKPVAVP